MRTLEIAIEAGGRVPFQVNGDFFYLKETTSAVDIEFQQLGATKYEARGVEFGYHTRPDGGFDGLVFTSALAQTITVFYGSGDGGYDRITGSVQIIGQQGAITQESFSLTNAVQTLVAARATGKYTLIQNNDAAQSMRVTIDGSDPTAIKGFRIQPGLSMELHAYQTTGDIKAIMEAATATANNVEVAAG
jgi:hypothetical protein